ncbi:MULTISPECIES: curli production assembly/transport protein CsgE [unclassified Halomonas]|uniref:curli production assembly/transport protein CsgE n=1 Tax=unclassified Halomonas TaxID=2609666 RepID=UPI0021E5090C|nr:MULTISPECIES: curli production assembly/transport protein CsgE [unclassified Halomonas]UYF99960.1 curli production assembly/transport protein CsgE [Halomonas sp. GD1P12]WNL42290.1 curli production assembly/transport protein CsgE [Halomonas sp. PAMB 3264]
MVTYRFHLPLAACLLTLALSVHASEELPGQPVSPNQPASPSDSLPENEQEAVDAINRLSGPDGAEIEPRGYGSSELTGVMIDRTITMAGRSFYRAFSQRAMDSPLINNATITIQERPDARWGSQLWIMQGNQMYFRTQLSPRINQADEAANEAVQVVQEALLKEQLATALTSDKDLGSEELR